MRLEYIGLSELSGSLIALEGVKDVAYDEMAEVTLENGERRYGRVILIDGDRVVLQVFEGTRGISLENASTHFVGKSMDIALSKEMLGRDGFLERAWAWKNKYGDRIVEQLKTLGSSCDWERQRFTMDDTCARAVRETFVDLYKKKLIYKGKRIVNWCPPCTTAIADDEAEVMEKREAEILEAWSKR